MPNNKNILREKINEACPELMFTSVCRVSAENPKGVRKNWKKPHLEHLLRTLKEEYVIYPQSSGLILIQFENENRDFVHYDISKPPLEQSEEVIEALLKIINA